MLWAERKSLSRKNAKKQKQSRANCKVQRNGIKKYNKQKKYPNCISLQETHKQQLSSLLDVHNTSVHLKRNTIAYQKKV